MMRGWAYGNEAADGRISDPVGCLLSGRGSRVERGLRPRISSCAKAGSSAAQLPDAREPVEHRSLAVGIASRLGGKGEPDPSSGASF